MIRCYVTDRHQGNLLAAVERAVAAGIDMIQVREKDLDAGTLYALVSQVRDIAAGSRTKVLVNDRLDVALSAGVDGVHLPGSGLPAGRVRHLVHTLGVSVHSLDEAVQAEQDRADFVIFGPVFATPGKQAVGLDALRQVTRAVRIPVLAIGGMTAERSSEIAQAGAEGFAAIRMFQRD